MSTSIFGRMLPYTIDTNDTFILKTGQTDSAMPSVRAVKLTKVGGFDGSIQVVARPRKSTADFVAHPYEGQYVNGSVADGSRISTAITDTTHMLLDDTALEIALICTGRTTGSMTLDNRSESDA